MIIDAAVPNDKQSIFLKSKVKFIAYGGARGGGKSWAVRYKAFLLASNYAGIKIMIMRRTYPELTENHINPLRQMIPKTLARYNDSHKEFRFRNGSRIMFGYCDKEKDLDKYQGTEYDVLFLDEATQFTETMYLYMKACVRGVNNFPKRVYLTCNPGGRGHAWVKRLFIDRKFKQTENPDDYIFIKAKVTDNKILMENDPDYLNMLMTLPEKKKKAWLDGDWDIFEGQVFEEFVDDSEHYQDRKYTHVIDPFEIPADWPIYRSYDFGYRKPFSCAWWTVDHDGVVYRIMEMYGCADQDKNPNVGTQWSPQKQFAEMKRVENEHPWLKNKRIEGVADPAIWNAESGESVAETAAKAHIYFQKGDHQRIAGLMQMHYRLAFDENGYPSMYIFRNCRAFIRTIPLLCYSETVAEDIDSDQEDHAYDEARYFCMSRPIKPKAKTDERPLEDDPLNMIKEMYNRR